MEKPLLVASIRIGKPQLSLLWCFQTLSSIDVKPILKLAFCVLLVLLDSFSVL